MRGCTKVLALAVAAGAVSVAGLAGAATEATAAPGGPDEVLGLFVWYKADSITGRKDGDVVTQWNDSKSGKLNLDKHTGNPVFVGSAINRLPAVRFKEGEANGLQTSRVVDALAGNPNVTVFVVAKVARPKREHVELLSWGNAARAGSAVCLQVISDRLDLQTGCGAAASTRDDAYAAYFDKPAIVMCAKAAGPLSSTTRITLDGSIAAVTGSDIIPAVKPIELSCSTIGKARSPNRLPAKRRCKWTNQRPSWRSTSSGARTIMSLPTAATPGRERWPSRTRRAWMGRLPRRHGRGTPSESSNSKSGGKLSCAIRVLVRGGKYYLNETLVFNPEDSGVQGFPVTYAAYPGEKPVLSGGRKITGWQPYKGRIVQCSVAEAKAGKWKFSQLFCDGQRQVRARYPNADPQRPWHAGWLPVEGPAEPESFVAFKYKAGGLPRHWAKPTQGDVFMIMDWGYSTITPIKNIDEQRRSITMTSGVRNFDRPPWIFPGSPGAFRSHFGCFIPFRFFVENLLEELDQPGE
jgi:hypothetical protein